MFPSSKASLGMRGRRKKDEEKPNIPGRVLAALLPGPYW